MFRIPAIVAAGTAAIVVAAVSASSARWHATTKQLRDRLYSAPRGVGVPAPFNAKDLDGLPEPVRRYFSFVLQPDSRWITQARLRFAGTFAAKPNAWAPFTSEQDVTARPPGFIWAARITMMHVFPIQVRDSYVRGEGAMLAAAATIIPVVDQHGTPEMAQASLQRFLAEAVWYPTALLPRDGVSWSAVDDSTARVTIVDGLTTASLNMKFNARGEIVGVTGLRYRDSNGHAVLTPWVGSFSEYRAHDGMMIPTVGEVAWVLATGRTPYWRGRLVDARFEP